MKGPGSRIKQVQRHLARRLSVVGMSGASLYDRARNPVGLHQSTAHQ